MASSSPQVVGQLSLPGALRTIEPTGAHVMDSITGLAGYGGLGFTGRSFYRFHDGAQKGLQAAEDGVLSPAFAGPAPPPCPDWE